MLVGRLFGRVEAMIAGGLLAATPALALAALQPNVDLPELAFLAASALALQIAAAGRRRWALAAGALLGLAILTRPTALAAVPILVLLMAARPKLRRLALPLMIGLAAMLLAEAAFYALWLGEPLKSWSLSLGHTDIATDQLPPGFHSNRGPLFNPDYIAGWRAAMDIRVHWLIDPVLNLIANPLMGALLLAALLLFLLARPKWSDPQGRALIFLLAGGVLWFGALTYGFAIDPKPRMFLPVAAVAAAIVAIVSVRLGRHNRLLAVLPATALLAAFLVRIHAEPDLSGLEAPASAWAARYRDSASVELRSARMLTLVPEVRALPVAPASGRSQLMIVAFEDCARVRPGWPVVHAFYVGREDTPPPGIEAPALCLLSRPEDPAAAPRR
jgi:4-amino-4-deoxy-L-arabinose transferase-like glycosyltransferase